MDSLCFHLGLVYTWHARVGLGLVSPRLTNLRKMKCDEMYMVLLPCNLEVSPHHHHHHIVMNHEQAELGNAVQPFIHV